MLGSDALRMGMMLMLDALCLGMMLVLDGNNAYTRYLALRNDAYA